MVKKNNNNKQKKIHANVEPRYNHTQCIITNSPRENKTVIKEKKRKKTMTTIQDFLTNIRERVHKRLSGNKMKKKKTKKKKKRLLLSAALVAKTSEASGRNPNNRQHRGRGDRIKPAQSVAPSLFLKDKTKTR